MSIDDLNDKFSEWAVDSFKLREAIKVAAEYFERSGYKANTVALRELRELTRCARFSDDALRHELGREWDQRWKTLGVGLRVLLTVRRQVAREKVEWIDFQFHHRIESAREEANRVLAIPRTTAYDRLEINYY